MKYTALFTCHVDVVSCWTWIVKYLHTFRLLWIKLPQWCTPDFIGNRCRMAVQCSEHLPGTTGTTLWRVRFWSPYLSAWRFSCCPQSDRTGLLRCATSSLTRWALNVFYKVKQSNSYNLRNIFKPSLHVTSMNSSQILTHGNKLRGLRWSDIGCVLLTPLWQLHDHLNT